MTAGSEAGQARISAIPPVGDSSFKTNLMVAAQGEQDEASQSAVSRKMPSSVAMSSANELAKGKNQRLRKEDVRTELSALGGMDRSPQPGFVPVQTCSWQLPQETTGNANPPAGPENATQGAGLGEQKLWQEMPNVDTTALAEVEPAPFTSAGLDSTSPQPPPDIGGAAPDANGLEATVDEGFQKYRPDVPSAPSVSPSASTPETVPAPVELKSNELAATLNQSMVKAQSAASTKDIGSRIAQRDRAASKGLPAEDASPALHSVPAEVPPAASPTSATIVTPAFKPAELEVARPRSVAVSDSVASGKTVGKTSLSPSSPAPSQDTLTGALQVGPIGSVNPPPNSAKDDASGAALVSEVAIGTPSAREDVIRSYSRTFVSDAVVPVQPGQVATNQMLSADKAQIQGGPHQASSPNQGQVGGSLPVTAGPCLGHLMQHSEMQLHVDAAEFGRVSVHATFGREGLAARISLEDTAMASALQSALSAHAPGLEHRLRGDLGTRAFVSVATDAGSSSSEGRGGQGEARSESKTPTPSVLNSNSLNYSAAPTSYPSTAVVHDVQAGRRVDVHI